MPRSTSSPVKVNEARVPKTYVDSLSSCRSLREGSVLKDAEAMCSRMLSHLSRSKGGSHRLRIDVLLERAHCYAATSNWTRVIIDCRNGLAALCEHAGKSEDPAEELVPKVHDETDASPQEIYWMQRSSLAFVHLEVQGTWKLRLEREFNVAIKRSVAICRLLKLDVLCTADIFKAWPKILKEAAISSYVGVWSSIKTVLDFLVTKSERITELMSTPAATDFLFFVAAKADSSVRPLALRGLLCGLRNSEILWTSTSFKFAPVLPKLLPCELKEESFLHLRFLLEVADMPSIRKCVKLSTETSFALLNMLASGGVSSLAAALILQKWDHQSLQGFNGAALCDSVVQLCRSFREPIAPQEDDDHRCDSIASASQLAFMHMHPVLSKQCTLSVEAMESSHLQRLQDQPEFLNCACAVLSILSKRACNAKVDWLDALRDPLFAGIQWIDSSCARVENRHLLLAWLHDLASIVKPQIMNNRSEAIKTFLEFVEHEVASSVGLKCLLRLLSFEAVRIEARSKPRIIEKILNACDDLCRQHGYGIDSFDVGNERKAASPSAAVSAHCTCACRVMSALFDDDLKAHMWANRLLVLRGPRRVMKWISLEVVDNGVAYTFLQNLVECGGTPLAQELWQLCSLTLENPDLLRSTLNSGSKSEWRNLILVVLRSSAEGALLQAWAEKVDPKDIFAIVQQSMGHDAEDVTTCRSCKKLSKRSSAASTAKSATWVHPTRFHSALKIKKSAGLIHRSSSLDNYMPTLDNFGSPLIVDEAEADDLDSHPQYHHNWRAIMHGQSRSHPDFLVYTPKHEAVAYANLKSSCGA